MKLGLVRSIPMVLLTLMFQSHVGHDISILAAQPNILVILTDDQAWSSLSCYGSKHLRTPHLDSLARDGVRFADAYVMPQCTPTRAGLFTGQHTARNGMWHVIGWYGYPWARILEPPFREQLPREWITLPKYLKAAGYHTGMAGKWHLTINADGDYNSLKPAAGHAYGFDYVAPRGSGSNNSGDKWVDHLTDHAIDFIRRMKESPWFFYLAHHTVHSVVSAPDSLIKKHRDAGAAEAGFHNATYLAALEHLDNSIGRLLKTIDELNLRENTLILFLSDNGGLDTNYLPPTLSGDPADGSVPLKMKSQEWDGAPLRAGKGSPYEGGIRVPCLLRWPKKIQSGQVIETPVHVIDWLPTLLAAAGREVQTSDGDGVNILPLLTGGQLAERPLFFHMPLYDLRWVATPCAVIREGDWKLIEHFGDSFEFVPEGPHYKLGRKVELYNLRMDLGETRDLSIIEPERVDSMSTKLHSWLESIPTPIPSENPHFDPNRQFEETKAKQLWNQ